MYTKQPLQLFIVPYDIFIIIFILAIKYPSKNDTTKTLNGQLSKVESKREFKILCDRQMVFILVVVSPADIFIRWFLFLFIFFRCSRITFSKQKTLKNQQTCPKLTLKIDFCRFIQKYTNYWFFQENFPVNNFLQTFLYLL